MSEGKAARIRIDDLPSGEDASRFEGREQGTGISFFVSRHRPGRGPGLHRHPYEEVFIMEAGEAEFTVGDETLTAAEGEIVVVPAGTPHKFVCTGDAPLRQLSIHPVPRMETEWLE